MSPVCPARSERGVALIIVLLLLAVISGLATGMTVNSQVEIAMATNESSYAGARAAAEAGMNRAIEAITANTNTDLLAGADGLVDAATPGAAVNADNGSVTFLLGAAGPYALGTSGQYTYTIQIFDDDDLSLYTTALTPAQLADMSENANAYIDVNDRLILRATGFGPSGTTVRVSRVLENIFYQEITANTTLSNPAILVNGDLSTNGTFNVVGTEGNIHTNGNMTVTGVPGSVTGDATATGSLVAPAGWHADGAQGGGRPTINVPDIVAEDYKMHADVILSATGLVLNPDLTPCVGCAAGWTFNLASGTWSTTGAAAATGTYFVYGKVSITASTASGGAPVVKALSVIATGSITVTGRNFLTPENDAHLQFVTNGDLKLSGLVGADDPTSMEGQSLVREQLDISGNPVLQGRILVQDVDSVDNLVTANHISGTPTITYNGTLGPIPTTTPVYGVITYTNNVSGWMESQ